MKTKNFGVFSLKSSSQSMYTSSPSAAVLSINSELGPNVLWEIYDAVLYETPMRLAQDPEQPWNFIHKTSL